MKNMRLLKILLPIFIIAFVAAMFLRYGISKPKDIFEAAKLGDKNAVQRFLDAGVDVHAKESEWGATPLHIAAANGHSELIELLVSAGAEIDGKDSLYSETPLHYAVTYGKKEVVEILVEKGADINANSRLGVTPIHGVAMGWGDYIEVAEFLIENGADINKKDMVGMTPLHKAVQNGEPGVLKVLLLNGGDTAIEDQGGLTPLELAEALCGRGPRVGGDPKLKPKYEECVRLLEDYAAK